MPAPVTIFESMLYSTVKLSGFKGHTPVGTGTGFFWRIQEGTGHAIVIATNKHVIEGCDRLEAVCHVADKGGSPSGSFANVSMNVDPAGVFAHPDPNVDLCALGFSDLMAQADASGHPIFLRALEAENIPTSKDWADFDAVENVLMIGCPRGIYDEVNNFPIVRQGITATSLANNYNGAPEFMIDMACFPGSSGSPVFMNKTGYVDKSTGSYMIDAHRFFFLGVLYAGPLITNKGEIKFGHAPTVEVAAIMHLGQVVKSTEMRSIEALVRARLGPAPAAR